MCLQTNANNLYFIYELAFFIGVTYILNPLVKKKSTPVIGRHFETEELNRIGSKGDSAILVMYGRRRVGKTFLIENIYAERNLIKIEGTEGVDSQQQLQLAKQQLASYVTDASFKYSAFKNWLEFFQFLAEQTKTGVWTLYFEELQWLAGESSSFISEFKTAWDNYFRHNPNLLVVLCGSSPSFMITEVLRSKALYNRSQHEIHLQPFSLEETHAFLGSKYSKEQALDAQLLVGGIPEYLKYLKKNSSIFLSLCDNSFKSSAFFLNEYERVFTSTLSQNHSYRAIIEILSTHGPQPRSRLLKKLKLKSGGGISKILDELVLCGFIERYAPYHLPQDGKSVLYAISDNYFHFFNKFIRPNFGNIQAGRFNKNPALAIQKTEFDQFLSYRLEHFCRQNHPHIAEALGFSAVKYQAGTYFKRASIKGKSGYQWDLVFDRADKVLTLCEIKYTNAPVGLNVIKEFESRIEKTALPKKKSIHRVLISVKGASPQLINAAYFDQVLTIKDL